MRDLKVDFKFHNVGQGLFYTGRLKYRRASFNFVYDCGAWEPGKDDYYTNIVKNAIRREFSKYDTLDLLIISHLHADHTNGIPYLLNRVKEVDTVILPYLSPLERLIVALTTPQASEEYYSFLADPVAYSLEHNVRRVVLLGGEEPSRGEEWLPPFERPPDLPPREGAIRLDIDSLPDDERFMSEISTHESLSRNIEEGKLFVKNHSGNLLLRLGRFPIWIFRFFNYKVRSNVLFQFENCIRGVLGSVDSGAIKDAIRDEDKLKKLKPCYNNLSKHLRNFNNTSLIVLHLPAFRQYIMDYECEWSWQLCCSLCSECWPCYSLFERRIVPSNFVQFLTGDINLKYKFSEISQHFGLGTAIRNTVATLIPHHGSHNNWNNALCSPIGSSITSNFWVVSAGLHNKHGHPSCTVIRDVCKNCKYPCVVWVNEATYFRLMGTLQF